MAFILLLIQPFLMVKQTLQVELLSRWKLERESLVHKQKSKRRLYLTMKLSHIGRQLSGVCNQFRAHLGDFGSLSQFAMINNELICLKYVSDSIICAPEELDGIRFNLCTCLNGEKLYMRKKYGPILRPCCLRTSSSMIESHNFIITSSMSSIRITRSVNSWKHIRTVCSWAQQDM